MNAPVFLIDRAVSELDPCLHELSDLEDDLHEFPMLGVRDHMTNVIDHLRQTSAASRLHRHVVLVRLQCAFPFHFRAHQRPPGLDLPFN